MLNRIRVWILTQHLWVKLSFVFLIDVLICLASSTLSLLVRIYSHNEFLISDALEPIFVLAMFSVSLYIPIGIFFGAYKEVFRLSDVTALRILMKCAGVYAALFALGVTIQNFYMVPLSVGLLQPFVLFSLVGFSRVFARVVLAKNEKSSPHTLEQNNIVIYGAGRAGVRIAKVIKNTPGLNLHAFVDDDQSLHGRMIGGVRVLSAKMLPDLSRDEAIDEIVLAMPNISLRRKSDIVEALRHINVLIRTIPSQEEILYGKVSISEFRPLSIEEILGRDPVAPDMNLMKRDIIEKGIMVTGAGGSIGSELCRQILHQKPNKLILLEQNEFALFKIQTELQKLIETSDVDDCLLVPMLGSVLNHERLSNIVREHSVDTIYHAAAHKHVHLVELNPFEALTNNVIGTRTLAQVAMDHGITKFVLISTDKAVRPTSIMGASKRLSEMCLQALSAESDTTKFAMVRFGNVLGSSGSVVPLFKEQIKNGGPITITDKEVTRYFMTISEAAQLVIQAGAMTDGFLKNKEGSPAASVYLLDMGEPVRIYDLAVRMVELSGLTVFDPVQNSNGDIEIEVIGLRPGEKLHEELLIGGAVSQTSHPKINVAVEEFLNLEDLDKLLGDLENCVKSNDANALGAILKPLFNDLWFLNEKNVV